MERGLRTLVLLVGVGLSACSDQQGDCLVHSQCAAKQQCVEGRCTVPVDAGRPEAGPDATVPDAASLDAAASDATALDAVHSDVINLDMAVADSQVALDAMILDAIATDIATHDVHWVRPDAGAVVGDASPAPADGAVPTFDGGSLGD